MYMFSHPLVSYTWESLEHLRLNRAETQFLILSLKTTDFPKSVDDTSTLPDANKKTLEACDSSILENLVSLYLKSKYSSYLYIHHFDPAITNANLEN